MRTESLVKERNYMYDMFGCGILKMVGPKKQPLYFENMGSTSEKILLIFDIEN